MDRHSTKLLIIEKAKELIIEDGPESISANKIIKKAGISKGGFYHHFKEIEELYLCLMEEMFNSFGGEIDPTSFASLEELLKALTDTAFKDIEKNRDMYRGLYFFIMSSKNNQKYSEKMKEMMDYYFSEWMKIFKFYLPKKVTAAKRDIIVRMFDSFYSGVYFHDLIFKDPKKYKKVANEFNQLMIQYVEGI